jgi:hypothetical protein
MEQNNVKPFEKPETEEIPDDKVATEGRKALLSFVDLLDATPNVPVARKDWLRLIQAIDRELVAGVHNARQNGNLHMTQEEPKAESADV